MLNNNTSGHKEFLKSLNWQVIKLNNNTHNSNLFPKASIFYKKKCSFYSSLQKGNIMMTFKQERREVKALLLPMKRSAPGHPRIQGKRLNKLPLTTEHDSGFVQRKMDFFELRWFFCLLAYLPTFIWSQDPLQLPPTQITRVNLLSSLNLLVCQVSKLSLHLINVFTSSY